jgi:transposase
VKSTVVDPRTREAIVRARAQRHSYDQLTDMFGVGRATVSRLLRLHRETGAVEPRPRGGGSPSPIQGQTAELLCALVLEHADATVEELAGILSNRTGLETSRSSVYRALMRLGFSRKKTFFAVERDSVEWNERHQSFCSFINSVAPERLVFLDESGGKTGMRRAHGLRTRLTRCRSTARSKLEILVAHWRDSPRAQTNACRACWSRQRSYCRRLHSFHARSDAATERRRRHGQSQCSPD